MDGTAVTGTSNNGCTFCLRSSCYTGLTGLLEAREFVREMTNGRGRDVAVALSKLT